MNINCAKEEVHTSKFTSSTANLMRIPSLHIGARSRSHFVLNVHKKVAWAKYHNKQSKIISTKKFTILKVAFFKKVLVHLSFLQTDKPHYLPDLEFWICKISKGSNHVK